MSGLKWACLDKSAHKTIYIPCYYSDEDSDENTCNGLRERISLNSILSDDGLESHISVPTTPSSNGNPDNFIKGTSGYESGESGTNLKKIFG